LLGKVHRINTLQTNPVGWYWTLSPLLELFLNPSFFSGVYPEDACVWTHRVPSLVALLERRERREKVNAFGFFEPSQKS
jgi:hypothetical protein